MQAKKDPAEVNKTLRLHQNAAKRSRKREVNGQEAAEGAHARNLFLVLMDLHLLTPLWPNMGFRLRTEQGLHELQDLQQVLSSLIPCAQARASGRCSLIAETRKHQGRHVIRCPHSAT